MKKFFILGLAFIILVTVVASMFFIPNSACKKSLETLSLGDTNLKENSGRGALISYYNARKNCLLLYADPVLYLNINKAEEARKQKAEVIAFLKDSAAETETTDLKKEIEAVKGVREARVITKEKALELYKERYKDQPVLLEFVIGDIFPASIEVYFDDFSAKDKVAELIKKKTFVESVTEDKLLENLTK